MATARPSQYPEDPIEAARALVPLIRACADEAERERQLPQRLADALAAAGLHRIAAPRSLGGLECEPRRQIETIEIVSAADGAAGWTLMIGIEILGFLGPAMQAEAAAKLYSDPGLIGAGALNPLGRATPAEGGFRVSGQWPFASGCHNAHYFWGQCIVQDGGAPAQGPGGGPVLREAVIPAADFEILDTWHVSGLRGSGSHDVVVSDVFVPEERMTATFGRPPRETGTLYRFPAFNRLAYNKVGVATGIARAALDHFAELAAQKKPRASATLLRDKVSVQLAVAEAEACLRSARAFVFESVDTVWRATEEGRTPTPEEQALVHLACTQACVASIKSVEIVHAAAGTTANFTTSPLERCMRDVRVIPQHIMVGPQWKEYAGRVLLGA
jgi:alkylation response protein AidB-like acyl-CoA dehydrogenase